MKRALTEPVDVVQAGDRYWLSIIEKENDTGISFNQRIFFLLENHHIGYVSEVKMNIAPDKVSFDKSKMTVSIPNIRSIGINKNQFTIKFQRIEDNKKIERSWIWRCDTEEHALKWKTKLDYERSTFEQTRSKIRSPKKEDLRQYSLGKSQMKPQSGFELTKEYEITLVSAIKKQQLQEIGTVTTPRKEEKQEMEGSNMEQIKLENFLLKDKSSSVPPKDNSVPPKNNLVAPKEGLSASPSIDKSLERPEIQTNEKVVAERKEPMEEGPLPRSSQGSIIQKQNQDTSNPKSQTNINEQPVKLPEQKSDKDVESKSLIKQGRVSNSQLSNKMYYNEGQEAVPLTQFLQMTSKVIKETNLNEEQDLPQRRLPPSPATIRRINQQADSVVKGATMTKQSQSLPQIHVSVAQPKFFGKKSTFQPEESSFNAQRKELERQPQKSPEHPLPEEQVAWANRYLIQREGVYSEFKDYCLKLLHEIVSEFNLPERGRKYRPKLLKHSLQVYQIEEVQASLALISLEDSHVKESQRLCEYRAVKLLECQFKNYAIVEELLEAGGLLRVPLVTLCELYGFVALFKVSTHFAAKNLSPILPELQSLQERTRIQHDFASNPQHIILPIDLAKYPSVKRPYQIIQEIDSYLLPDYHFPHALYRYELLSSNHSKPIVNTKRITKSATFKLQPEPVLVDYIQTAIQAAVKDLDALRVYFITPSEVSTYFHSKGIGMRHLGQVYRRLTTPFARKEIMTEIAARSCKQLFRKTLQDITFDRNDPQDDSFMSKVIDFLNFIVGSTYETAAIWKLLSTQSLSYFQVEINFNDIHKGLFVIGLAKHCELDVNWQRVRPEQIFKVNSFFNERNVSGVNGKSKCYKVRIPEQVRSTLAAEESLAGFEKLIGVLEASDKATELLKNEQLQRYLANFISPQEPHSLVQLFSQKEQPPSQVSFHLTLTEIKWNLKLSKRDIYIRLFNQHLEKITRFFGEFHLLQVQLYELFSSYHLNREEYEDAITFSKSALINLLKIAGSSHPRTAQSYYSLALCYAKANKREEAIMQLKKAKFILQQNDGRHSTPYALLSLKLAVLHLNQNQTEECLQYAIGALDYLEGNADEYESEIIEGYETLSRCYEILQLDDSSRELSSHCYSRLKWIKSAGNLERALKIFVTPVLTSLNPQQASSLLDLLTLLPLEAIENGYDQAAGLLQERVNEDSLRINLESYMDNIISIEKYVSQKGVLKDWTNFSEVYTRDTVHDFLSLLEQLLYFVGEVFLMSTLKESL